ncbi:MAG: coenzyme F420-0:L-glutamate ligase [Pseudomonadales bacterium]
MRGAPDLFGRTLEITQVGIADEVAAAASLLMGQAGEGSPVVLVRGLQWTAKENASVQTLLRKPHEDMFR